MKLKALVLILLFIFSVTTDCCLGIKDFNTGHDTISKASHCEDDAHDKGAADLDCCQSTCVLKVTVAKNVTYLISDVSVELTFRPMISHFNSIHPDPLLDPPISA